MEMKFYTCPMHPEVISDKPGSCPKCGMALEPKSGAVSPDDKEYRDLLRRFWVSLGFTVPIVLLAALEMFPMNWVSLILTTPVVLWGGWWFFERGALSVVRRNLNMFTLIALGVGVAYVYSRVAVFFPGIFPDTFKSHGSQVPVYFEAAAVIT